MGPEHPGLHDLHDPAIVFAGVDLRAHLRDDLLAGGRFHHEADFVHRMGQRFLAVKMLAGPHGRQPGKGMMVVRRGDNDGLEVLLLHHRR